MTYAKQDAQLTITATRLQWFVAYTTECASTVIGVVYVLHTDHTSFAHITTSHRARGGYSSEQKSHFQFKSTSR